MNYAVSLLSALLFTQVINAQIIQEICESSITNGVIVHCQVYNDTLYSTGFFNIICGNNVGYIAKWENDGWKPSSINISDPGHSLKAINNKLYIAKYEESIDSNWVYTYENFELSKIGKGVYLTSASGFSELPNIYDIIEYKGKIIACGEFDKVGDENIQGIMQWDGNNWEALDSGLSGNIDSTAPVMFPHQMMVHQEELYVVGNFKTAGGLEVNGIAKWDGNSWINLGAGFNSTVYCISVFENNIIVGGSFTESEGSPLNRIAKWNGTNWVPLEFGFSQTSSNDFIFVHTLEVIDDILYIGGGLKEITYPDNSTEICNGIISFSNNKVNTFMGGVAGNDIEAICKTDHGKLIFGGGVFGSGYSGIVNIKTSANSSLPSPKVQIAPNPFENYISIETTIEVDEFEITNELGLQVMKGAFTNNIHLNIPAGIYFITLYRNGDSISTDKIIKL